GEQPAIGRKVQHEDTAGSEAAMHLLERLLLDDALMAEHITAEHRGKARVSKGKRIDGADADGTFRLLPRDRAGDAVDLDTHGVSLSILRCQRGKKATRAAARIQNDLARARGSTPRERPQHLRVQPAEPPEPPVERRQPLVLRALQWGS